MGSGWLAWRFLQWGILVSRVENQPSTSASSPTVETVFRAIELPSAGREFHIRIFEEVQGLIVEKCGLFPGGQILEVFVFCHGKFLLSGPDRGGFTEEGKLFSGSRLSLFGICHLSFDIDSALAKTHGAAALQRTAHPGLCGPPLTRLPADSGLSSVERS